MRELDFTDVAHTGPGTLAGRYLRSFWQPVYRGEDLPAGRAAPVWIMSEDLTIFRGESGQVHALGFRCAHRGTQLSTGWVEGDNLRCFYHGWTYDPSGQCVEQPAEPEPFCERIRVRGYPAVEYLGLVFVYLGEGEVPPPPHFPEYDRAGVLVVSRSEVWPCNYFNRVENAVDPVHFAFAHREGQFSDNGIVGIPAVSGEETDYGIITRADRGDNQVRINHFHMPNGFKSSQFVRGGGWGDRISWYVPIDDAHFVTYGSTLFPVAGEEAERFQVRMRQRPEPRSETEWGDAVLAGTARLEDFPDRNGLTPAQDYVAQVGQGAIPPRDQDHLGRGDVLLALLRRIWARELRNLAEGKPIKRWVRNYPLVAEVGAPES